MWQDLESILRVYKTHSLRMRVEKSSSRIQTLRSYQVLRINIYIQLHLITTLQQDKIYIYEDKCLTIRSIFSKRRGICKYRQKGFGCQLSRVVSTMMEVTR
jgi:hypothetical protein